jgi:hypothetical protein
LGKASFASTSLRRFKVPASVEIIKESCFEGVKSLCELTFEGESRLKRIQKNAFRETSLRSVKIPASVEYIGSFCFYDCKVLSEVTFEPNSRLKEICEKAFYGTALTDFRVPSSVEKNEAVVERESRDPWRTIVSDRVSAEETWAQLFRLRVREYD